MYFTHCFLNRSTFHMDGPLFARPTVYHERGGVISSRFMHQIVLPVQFWAWNTTSGSYLKLCAKKTTLCNCTAVNARKVATTYFYVVVAKSSVFFFFLSNFPQDCLIKAVFARKLSVVIIILDCIFLSLSWQKVKNNKTKAILINNVHIFWEGH